MMLILIAVTGYLIGSLPVFTLLHSRRVPRVSHLSPGGIRPGRGLREGMIFAGLQMVKGALATLTGLLLAGWTGGALAAAAAVLGDLFSLFRHVHGGGGVAVAAGGLLILSPLLVALGMSIYLLTLVLTRYFSVSVLFASIGVMVFSLVLFPGVYVVLVVLFAGGVIWLRNRGRPDRWFKGMEPPVWKRGFRRWR